MQTNEMKSTSITSSEHQGWWKIDYKDNDPLLTTAKKLVVCANLYEKDMQGLLHYWRKYCNIMAEGFRFIYLAFGFS